MLPFGVGGGCYDTSQLEQVEAQNVLALKASHVAACSRTVLT